MKKESHILTADGVNALSLQRNVQTEFTSTITNPVINMKKNLPFLAIAFVGGLLLSGCKNDDNEDTVAPESSTLTGRYIGVTTGSSQHFQGLSMPNVTDTVFVSTSAQNSETFDIRYKSAYWGEATFANVSAQKVNGTWLFGEAAGTIMMPNRNPNGGSTTFNEYPATLTASSIGAQQANGSWQTATFTVNANLGERVGIYTMVFATK